MCVALSVATSALEHFYEVAAVALGAEHSDKLASESFGIRSSLGLRDQVLKAHLLRLASTDADITLQLSRFKSAYFSCIDDIIENFLNTPEGRAILDILPEVPTPNALLVDDPLNANQLCRDSFLAYVTKIQSKFGLLDLPGGLLSRSERFFTNAQEFEIHNDQAGDIDGSRKIGSFRDEHIVTAFKTVEYEPIGKSLISFSIAAHASLLFDMCSGLSVLIRDWQIALLPSHNAALLIGAPDRFGGREIVCAWGKDSFFELSMPKRRARLVAEDEKYFYLIVESLRGDIDHYLINRDSTTPFPRATPGNPSLEAPRSNEPVMSVVSHKEPPFSTRVDVFRKI